MLLTRIMIPKNQAITKRCLYLQSCQFADTSECIDNILGCMMVHRNSESYKSENMHQEEAENPEKRRHVF